LQIVLSGQQEWKEKLELATIAETPPPPAQQRAAKDTPPLNEKRFSKNEQTPRLPIRRDNGLRDWAGASGLEKNDSSLLKKNG